MPGFGLRRF